MLTKKDYILPHNVFKAQKKLVTNLKDVKKNILYLLNYFKLIQKLNK
jgi:hypothetical protein